MSMRRTAQMCALGMWCFVSTAFAGGLTDLLMSQVGVTKPQAVGGSGAIFNYAKSQLAPDKFSVLKAAVPGMDKYLAAAPMLGAAAPAQTTKESGMGALANQALQMAGGTEIGGKLQAIQQLAPAFEKLGLKPKMITKFAPVITNYLQGAGNGSAASLLTGALGF